MRVAMRVAVVTFLSRRLHRSTSQLWSPSSAATTCLDSASRLLVCTLAYGRRGLQALQAQVLVGEVTRCPQRLQAHSLM